ncbi:glycine cleavage system protein R [Polymorphum gilvum]|uniref:ACT domain protein n=1 Tax=Polymorphum gilvum (strain LMG 25793 / CGMCC 1.9160 / SL003B-26A1) TaxID=991905 RepID=F2J5E5_POLGS|nr:ACT domain-containing protein [Polymorphum gilvum]ADZ72315.1 ACT domain protein [Polymorphum gilvum SL003B-26A1]
MTRHMVLTVIAKDRPGLVDRLADLVADAGANWVESSMTRLGGEFAGIVGIEVPEAAAEGLAEAFAALATEGISVTVRAGEAPAEVPGARVRLDLVSQDHPGILRAVTHVLAEQGVSIDDLETGVFPGSMSGEAMFKATALLRLPDGVEPARLRDALQAIAGDIMAEIDLAD